MKKWEKVGIKIVDIKCTGNEPTSEIICDDFQDGYFLIGDRTGSGSETHFEYRPDGQ